MADIDILGLKEAWEREGGNVAYTNALTQHVEAFYREAHDLMLAKNHDYAGSLDPLANFREAEKLGIPIEKSIAVRMGDKWARLCRILFTGHNALPTESLHDTLVDLANYAGILDHALMEEAYGPKDGPVAVGEAGAKVGSPWIDMLYSPPVSAGSSSSEYLDVSYGGTDE